MCGIIGAALRCGNAAEEVFAGLKRLEYRGYDSAGLSIVSGGAIRTVKRSGRVQSLEGGVLGLRGKIGIGHTRWATHGAASDINAHPHVSGGISVVHNGIIENWRYLKDRLTDMGYRFVSDTDSEVVAKLIDSLYQGDLLKAAASAARKLKGSFALAIVCKDCGGIVAIKYKSPAVIGFSERGNFVCSDVPALPVSVNSICIPEDGDVAYITARSVHFYDFNLTPVSRERKKVVIRQSAAGLCGNAHYMIKEIKEAPATIKNTCESFLRVVDTDRLRTLLRGADRVIFTGCGTAYNAGLAAREYFKDKADVACGIASELRYDLPAVSKRSLAFAITQSGETADTVEAVMALKAAGASVVAITNCGYSAITRIADMVVPVCAGAEICVAATKSYIGQLAALYLISCLTEDGDEGGGAHGGAVRAANELVSLCGSIESILSDSRADDFAALCANSRAVFFLGRGADYAVAVEAALKLKEVSYIFSDGYPAGELKHGTLALIDGNTLSVFIICNEQTADKCENAVEQVVSRGGKTAVITTLKGVKERLKGTSDVWYIGDCPQKLAPFLCACALQLVAYKTAQILGRDPDKPRNLAKSVTVE